MQGTFSFTNCCVINNSRLTGGKHTGLYYLDSTKMAVCHNRRIYRNKVFKGIAERGHCSVSFFYGFKLHLAIHHQGEIVSFCITKGNVDDREVVEKLTQGLTGFGAGKDTSVKN